MAAVVPGQPAGTTQEPPRIGPGTRKENGWLNTGLIWVLTKMGGGDRPLNILTTLARHRKLFRAWVRFAGALMPRGTLPRTDTELLILRVAHNCDSAYEWTHHVEIAESVGMSSEEVQRVTRGPAAEGWSERQAALLRAADDLHRQRAISTEVWEELSPFLSETELIEVCMLVGHYEMLAMTLRSLQIPLDAHGSAPPRRLRRGKA